MTERIRPILDYKQDNKNTERMDALLDVKGAQRWVDETEEGAEYSTYYASPQNYSYLQGWLTANGDLPVTKTNLSVAFRELVADGILKKNPPAPVEPASPAPFEQPRRRFDTLGTVTLRHEVDESELARLKSLSDIGKPVSAELRAAHQQSLQENRTSQRTLPRRWAECRAVVALNEPTLKLDSLAFNAKVAELLAEHNSNGPK